MRICGKEKFVGNEAQGNKRQKRKGRRMEAEKGGRKQHPGRCGSQDEGPKGGGRRKETKGSK